MPCGTTSKWSLPAMICSSASVGGPGREEKLSTRWEICSFSARSCAVGAPCDPRPLQYTVRSRAPWSASASSSEDGKRCERPNTATATEAPSGLSATAAAGDSTTLSVTGRPAAPVGAAAAPSSAAVAVTRAALEDRVPSADWVGFVAVEVMAFSSAFRSLIGRRRACGAGVALEREPAAVDGEDLAGDPAGRLGGEEERRGRDVPRVTLRLQGDVRPPQLTHLLVHAAGGKRAPDHPDAYAVDPDAPRREAARCADG